MHDEHWLQWPISEMLVQVEASGLQVAANSCSCECGASTTLTVVPRTGIFIHYHYCRPGHAVSAHSRPPRVIRLLGLRSPKKLLTSLRPVARGAFAKLDALATRDAQFKLMQVKVCRYSMAWPGS